MRPSRVEYELNTNPRGRVVVSWGLAVANLGMMIVYVFPVPLARRAGEAAPVNIIRFLEHCLGLWWPLLFGAAAVTLVVTLSLGRWIEWGHVVSLVAWATWGAAALAGAVLSGGPVVSGWEGLTVGWVHYSLIISYTTAVVVKSSDGGR